MSYKTFFKIWLKYNMSVRNNLNETLVYVASMICAVIFIMDDQMESLPKVVLTLMSYIFIFLVMSVRICLPRLLYIEPLSKEDKITYVKRAYWTRIIIAEAVYVCVSLVFCISHNISGFYFICVNIGNFIMLQSANNMSFIRLENISQKNMNEMNNMVYGTGGQIAGMCMMSIGGLSVMFMGFSYRLSCFLMGVIIFFGVIYFKWFYSRQYKKLMEISSNYESQDGIRRIFSIR